MKRIFSKEKSRKEKKADFYILYTIVFAAISLFIYSCFYFNGKSLIWSHDGVPQHINALAYYGKYLRNVLQTLVTEHCRHPRRHPARPGAAGCGRRQRLPGERNKGRVKLPERG